MSREVIGYHGTTRAAARRLIQGGPWTLSSNDWDWLGDGIYFWEYGPIRAWEWACQAHTTAQAAVIRARITLDHCLDLTDLRGTREVQGTYGLFRDRMERVGIKLPENRGRHHGLDRLVINFFVSQVKPTRRVVRAAFVEGERLWPGSDLYEKTHIQLAVRDPALLRDVRGIEDVDHERF